MPPWRAAAFIRRGDSGRGSCLLLGAFVATCSVYAPHLSNCNHPITILHALADQTPLARTMLLEGSVLVFLVGHAGGWDVELQFWDVRLLGLIHVRSKRLPVDALVCGQ